jgi:hypothetical protein
MAAFLRIGIPWTFVENFAKSCEEKLPLPQGFIAMFSFYFSNLYLFLCDSSRRIIMARVLLSGIILPAL